jgi:phosphatidylinositol dimannoside acyltransferase
MNHRYNGLCLAAFLVRFVPLRFGYFLAACGGNIFSLLSDGRRKTVSNNMQRAIGKQENTRLIQQKVRQVFRNAAKNYFDILKLSQINWHDLDSKVKIIGMSHLTGAVNEGKGVIIATAHLGNFEFGAHAVASQGIDMLILVEAFNSTPFLRKLAALRRGKRVRVVPTDIGGMKDAFQTLRRGGTVTIVCDRDIEGNGIKTQFLGQETSFPVGVVDLALRTGAAIIPIFSLRQSNNTTNIFIEPPLILSDIRDRDQALKVNLDRLVAVLEKYIRAYPEQWVVLEPL